MQIIPLKEKLSLGEQDIDDLSRMLAEGCSLAHMAFFFKGRMTSEQIYVAAGIIANVMYELPLQELCPYLVDERRQLNAGKGSDWNKRKIDEGVLETLKQVREDLAFREMELAAELRAKI